MLMRCTKAYGSSCLQVILVHRHFVAIHSFVAKNCPKHLKSIFLGFKVIQGDRCWHSWEARRQCLLW